MDELPGNGIRFGILGPLQVRDGNTVVGVPAPRQRVLLAALLVHAGQAVAADALAETVWDGAPPPGAAATLRSHVMRLRRVLGPRAGARVVTRYPGYLVDAGQEEVDLLRFTRLCREGGAAVRAGAWAEASGMLSEALGLWRGPPLADIPAHMLRRDETPELEQLHLQAAEWQIDAELNLGRHGEMIPRLQSLATEHPLREHFHAQLMLALYRCGRQAEALAAYRRARRVLVDELGTEPGSGLRELHQRMLAADPVLAGPEPVPPPARGSRPVVPRELPGEVRHFAGRADELAALSRLLDQADKEPPGTVLVSAIGGTAGVGKTALAVHWAHQVAERFPDGQLYVNLRGYDPDQPVPPADALAGFLRALGVPGQDIPPEAGERAARYRSLLAGRRMLVVLDNARSAEQVRSLLPGTKACVAVVTSRDALGGLVAREGAERLEVDLLPLPEAVGLLRALIGGRVDADPAAAEELATQCSRLPLALRVAAELAIARPAASLAELAGELADQQQRLDVLDADGDSRTAVRAVFSWSYRHLDSSAARAFRLAALHPGPDLDRYAAAALTGTTVERAGRVLDQLTRMHLIHPSGPGRYGLHDLLRAYARELAAAQDGEDERWAAQTRLFDYYLHTAAAAANTLFPAESAHRPRVPPPVTPGPPVAGPAAARAWLDAERAVLVAVTAHTAAHGWPGHTTRLAVTLFRYLDVGGHLPEATAIHSHARSAASQTGDRAAEAEALVSLGVVDHEQGRDEQAADHLQQALALFRKIGDPIGQARALNDLGGVDLRQGRYRQAAGHFQQALALRRGTGDQAGQARALSNLGRMDLLQGRHQQAVGHLEEALDLCRKVGDRTGEAYVLNYLGRVDLLQGRCRQAVCRLEQALALNQEIGNRPGEAYILANLGLVELRQGHHEPAARHHRQALALFREIGDRSGEAEALNGLGEVFLATGRVGHARAQHATALAVARQLGDRDQQARAREGLARARQAEGNPV